MRLPVFCVLLLSTVVSAQELSAPPLPPDVTPDSALPRTNDAPPEARGFTGNFSSRISFFSTNEKLQYEVSLGLGREHCKTPCAIDTNAGLTEVTVSREGQRITEEHVVPSGVSHLLIKNYSQPLLTAGVVLLSLSATALIAAGILMATMPYAVFTWLLIVGAPALLLAGTGIPLTVVGARRVTMNFAPYALMHSGM